MPQSGTNLTVEWLIIDSDYDAWVIAIIEDGKPKWRCITTPVANDIVTTEQLAEDFGPLTFFRRTEDQP